MKNNKKRIVKMVTILCAAIFVLGYTTTAFAANDIIGRGTGGSSTSGSASRSSITSQTYSGQGSTAGTASAAGTGVATTSYANVKGSVGDPASVSKVGSQVPTGVTEKLMPILAVILAAVGAFWIFFHFQMNQVRYGKSEKYYKELLDFKVSCRI